VAAGVLAVLAVPAVVPALAVTGVVPAGAAGAAGAVRSRASYSPPPVNGRFDYQIGGAYRPVRGVRIVDRDRTARPAPGRYDICYVNAFQTQRYQDRWWKRRHRSLLLRDARGRLAEDSGWPGEFLLDTRTAAKRRALSGVIGRWIDGCARRGFDAVEPDNLDSDSRSHHLLTRADNLAFARLLAGRSHADDLAFAQKNYSELTAAQIRRVGFDFAIAEECQVYSECGSYLRHYGRHVLEIEYTDDGRRYYDAACRARGARISVILRDRDVVPRGRRGYVYQAC
jgi:hypothetical protein